MVVELRIRRRALCSIKLASIALGSIINIGFYMRTKPVIIAIAILAVVAIAGFWLWQKQTPVVPTGEEPSKSLGGQIFEQSANPVKEKLPETNPFTETETNPLDSVYKNPF